MFKFTSLIILAIVFISRFFGFLREISISNFFGVNDFTDAFFLSLTIPLVVSQIVGANIANKIIADIQKNYDKEKLSSIISSHIVTSAVILFVIGISFALSFDFLSPFKDLKLRTYNQYCIYVLSPSIVFWGMSYVLGGILNAHNKFYSNAFSPLISSFITILLYLNYRGDYYFLPIGMTIGSLFQFLFMLYFSRKYIRLLSLKYVRLSISFDLIKLVLPMIFSSIILQVPMILERYIVSGLEEGSITLLNYAQKTFVLLTSILIYSVIAIIYPILLNYIYNKKSQFQELFSSVNQKVLTISLGILIIIFMFIDNMVRILFFNLNMDKFNLSEFGLLIKLFSFSIFLYIIRDLLFKLLFGLKMSSYVLVISTLTSIINILLDVIFVNHFKIYGVALALFISLFFNNILIIRVLYKKGYINKIFLVYRDRYLLINIILFLCLLFNPIKVLDNVISFFSLYVTIIIFLKLSNLTKLKNETHKQL
jgi:putative peptidoglycan lipid II flippase